MHFLSSGISQLRCDSGRSSGAATHKAGTVLLRPFTAREQGAGTRCIQFKRTGCQNKKQYCTVMYCLCMVLYCMQSFAANFRTRNRPFVPGSHPGSGSGQSSHAQGGYCTVLYYTVLYSSWQPHRHEGSVHPAFSLKPGHAQGSTPLLSPLLELPSATSS
jgi:hypothetical protein